MHGLRTSTLARCKRPGLINSARLLHSTDHEQAWRALPVLRRCWPGRSRFQLWRQCGRHGQRRRRSGRGDSRRYRRGVQRWNGRHDRSRRRDGRRRRNGGTRTRRHGHRRSGRDSNRWPRCDRHDGRKHGRGLRGHGDFLCRPHRRRVPPSAGLPRSGRMRGNAGRLRDRRQQGKLHADSRLLVVRWLQRYSSCMQRPFDERCLREQRLHLASVRRRRSAVFLTQRKQVRLSTRLRLAVTTHPTSACVAHVEVLRCTPR
jgi:hypothetical protein